MIDLIKLQQMQTKFNELNLKLKKLKNSINLSELELTANEIEAQTLQNNFWNNSANT